MTYKLSAALIGALLALPASAQAQQTLPLADPADPGIIVPPIVYTPVAGRPVPASPDAQTTPDKAWRAANDAVGAVAGHAAAPLPSMPVAPVKPANPAPSDHSKHH